MRKCAQPDLCMALFRIVFSQITLRCPSPLPKPEGPPVWLAHVLFAFSQSLQKLPIFQVLSIAFKKKQVFIVFSICNGILSHVYTSWLYSLVTFVSIVSSHLSSDRHEFHIINLWVKGKTKVVYGVHTAKDLFLERVDLTPQDLSLQDWWLLCFPRSLFLR